MATSYNSISRNRRRGCARGDFEPRRRRRKRSLGSSTRFSVRFRGVSARYTSFNRIRMQCCGKFHLSEARGSEQAGRGRQRADLGGVDPAVTLSRLYGPPAEPSVPPRHTQHLHIHCSLSRTFAIAASSASR